MKIAKISREDILNIIFFFIISFLLVLDLFFNKGQSANMDGTVHITTIAQFYKAMKDGEWFVRWSDGFANYGLSVPLFAHQLVNYLGGFLTFITHDVLLSFNILFLIGSFLSTLFLYFFLRLYFSEKPSLAGAVLFHFSAYRIINLYIRGAIHEYFSAVFLPLILLSLYYLFHKRKKIYIFYLSLSFLGLLLTHPMMAVIYSFIIGPYILFLLWGEKPTQIMSVTRDVLLALVGSLLVSAYYYIPLYFEKKYYYFGQWSSQFVLNQTLGLTNFISPNWYYYFRDDVLTRGHFIKLGFIEALVILISLLSSVFLLIKKSYRTIESKLFICFSLLSLLVLFMTTEASTFFYKNFSLLGNIQFPWRMMSAVIFLPPILIAYLFSKIKNNSLLVFIFIILVCVSRYPQLYGKNYTIHPQSYYFFTPINLHSNLLNTIWTGTASDYPIKKVKGEIISGQGKIITRNEHNSWRQYEVDARTELRLADYTFYFPGWKVFIDNKETPIEFQDMNYRGVITYKVPQGKHTILVKFTETKIRLLADIISLFSIGMFGFLFILRKKLFHHPSQKHT